MLIILKIIFLLYLACLFFLLLFRLLERQLRLLGHITSEFQSRQDRIIFGYSSGLISTKFLTPSLYGAIRFQFGLENAIRMTHEINFLILGV